MSNVILRTSAEGWQLAPLAPAGHMLCVCTVCDMGSIGVLGGGPGGPWPPPWQKCLAWQNRIGWLGRKEIDSLAEKNWKA